MKHEIWFDCRCFGPFHYLAKFGGSVAGGEIGGQR